MLLDGQRVDEDYRKLFAGYLTLQNESYEFITRSIAIHNWLKEAHGMLAERPELSAEELYEAWRPSLGRVYNHLFAAFLRPYRIMMYPFGEFEKAQLESVAPRTIADTCLDMARLWGEGQSRFLKGLAIGFQRYGHDAGKFPGEFEESAIDAVQELTPLGLMKTIADEEMLAAFEMVDKMLRWYFGENQFLFTKSFVVYLHNVIAKYPEAYRVGQCYEAAFRNAWDAAIKKFTVEIKQTERPPEFDVFFKTYTNLLASEFQRALKSPEFVEVQNSFAETTADLISSTRKLLESQAEMFPALPFVMRSEMDALEKNVHSYKRRLNGLERKLRTADAGDGRAARVEALEQRVRELEEKLRLSTVAASSRNGEEAAKAKPGSRRVVRGGAND